MPTLCITWKLEWNGSIMADVYVGHCQIYSENTSHTQYNSWINWLFEQKMDTRIPNQVFPQYNGFIFNVVDDIKLRKHLKILHFKVKMPLKC